MMVELTIVITKILRAILKLIGRGSSMPGKIALKLCPDILSKIRMPKYVIAVTGSNGKTSTVEMIYQVLIRAGFSVAYNSEGSNQIDGVVTLVLNNVDIKGVFNKDILLLESDERYAQYTFKYFRPTHYVVTNLYRDQMTRNGNPDYVLGEIRKSIYPESNLILNADDPEIASLPSAKNKCYYFGINDNEYTKKKNNYLYDDGYYCPKCKAKLKYTYHQFAHVGKYSCTKCDFKRVNPDYYVSDIDLNKGKIVVNKKYEIKLAASSLHNVYNVLAAYSVSNLIGVDPSIICDVLSDYLIKNGRIKRFALGNKEGTLLISKHENSVSYNQNIEYVINQKKNITVFLMVDAISRKYFTSETSWLWDINFSLLNNKNVKKIIVTGIYASDIGERLSYTDINFKRVYVNKNIDEAIAYCKDKAEGYIYVLTCFSDEKKFTSEVDKLW